MLIKCIFFMHNHLINYQCTVTDNDGSKISFQIVLNFTYYYTDE